MFHQRGELLKQAFDGRLRVAVSIGVEHELAARTRTVPHHLHRKLKAMPDVADLAQAPGRPRVRDIADGKTHGQLCAERRRFHGPVLLRIGMRVQHSIQTLHPGGELLAGLQVDDERQNLLVHTDRALHHLVVATAVVQPATHKAPKTLKPRQQQPPCRLKQDVGRSAHHIGGNSNPRCERRVHGPRARQPLVRWHPHFTQAVRQLQLGQRGTTIEIARPVSLPLRGLMAGGQHLPPLDKPCVLERLTRLPRCTVSVRMRKLREKVLQAAPVRHQRADGQRQNAPALADPHNGRAHQERTVDLQRSVRKSSQPIGKLSVLRNLRRGGHVDRLPIDRRHRIQHLLAQASVPVNAHKCVP
ncbi:hypothetical protein D3C71_1080070 [compost metagenome]